MLAAPNGKTGGKCEVVSGSRVRASAAQTLVGCISRLMLTAERQQDHRGIPLTKIAAFIQLINIRNLHNAALSKNKTILRDFLGNFR